MLLLKFVSLLLDPKKLLLLLILVVGGLGFFHLQKGAIPVSNIQGVETQSVTTLSFGDSTKESITSLQLNPSETKSFYIWINSSSVRPFTNFGITVLYDPSTIRSLNIEQTKLKISGMTTLAQNQSTEIYMGKTYQAASLSLGSLCDTDYCSTIDTNKAPLAKVTVVAQSGNIKSGEIIIHPDSVAMTVDREGNVLNSDNVKALAINPSAQNNTFVVRAKLAGTNPNTAILELQTKTSTEYITIYTFEIDSTEFKDYVFTGSRMPASKNIRLRYTNDSGASKDVVVDYIKIGEKVYQTEDASTYSTGTWQNSVQRCAGGFLKTQTLHCNGYFEFFTSL